jgi:competence ComEA-like helix-hairpin-helix protein
MLYTRPQLRLLLVVAATLLVGFAVREWRAGFPSQAERLERFDRDEAPLLPVEAMHNPATASPVPIHRKERSRGAPAPAGGGRAGGAAGNGEDLTPAEADPRPLDLNRASVEQIARLPGIGASLARRIVQERERQGRFDSPEGLRHVYGLGPRKLAAIRDHVAVSE